MSRFKNLDYSYHNHTYRCGHAEGADEDYIKSAIAAGIKVYGVSDHIFLEGIIHPGMRGNYELLPSYLQMIEELQEKYRDQIDIYIAFEAEYLPEYLDYYKELLSTNKIDYLIIGQHGTIYEGGFRFYANLPVSPLERVQRYVDDLVAGMETGLFKIAAHPDIFFGYYPVWNEITLKATRRIIKAAKKHHVLLEINLGTIRLGKNGATSHDDEFRFRPPVREFWEEVAKSKVPVIIGIDAHNPNHFHDGAAEVLEELIGDLPLNYVNRVPNLVHNGQVVEIEKK